MEDRITPLMEFMESQIIPVRLWANFPTHDDQFFQDGRYLKDEPAVKAYRELNECVRANFYQQEVYIVKAKVLIDKAPTVALWKNTKDRDIKSILGECPYVFSYILLEQIIEEMRSSRPKAN